MYRDAEAHVDSRRTALLTALLGGCLLALAVILFYQPARARTREAERLVPRRASTAYTYTVFLPYAQSSQTQTVAPPPPLWATIDTRAASRSFYLTNFVSDTDAIPIGWTGDMSNCISGTVSVDFRAAVLRRVNFFRAMAGVPDNLTLNGQFNRTAQAAALMMSRNGTLTHSPSPSMLCYSDDGYAGASTSNLALGANGTTAINLYMMDAGTYNTAAGHRRWILFPKTRETGVGDIPASSNYMAANALHDYDNNIWSLRPATREPFVAWPPPGYVPYTIVYPRWTFAYDGANFDTAVVTMTQNGSSISVAQAAPEYGYGENALVWIPLGLQDYSPWPKPAADTTYHVEVGNVMINSQPRSFTYDVTVYDPAY